MAKGAIDSLVRNGSINKLVEDNAKTMLTAGNSSMRTRLTDAISEKFVQKMAELAVDRMLGPAQR
jgi:hypothetical protein